MQASIFLLALMLLSLPPADGDTCQEQHMLSACVACVLNWNVFSPVVSLPELHPAHVIFRNFVSGSCSVSRYREQRKETLRQLQASKDTILLVGGESRTSVPESNGTCAIEAHVEVEACTERYARDIFNALADDVTNPAKTYNGNPELPLQLNTRFVSEVLG